MWNIATGTRLAYCFDFSAPSFILKEKVSFMPESLSETTIWLHLCRLPSGKLVYFLMRTSFLYSNYSIIY